jgi:hypothetical protein
MPVVSPQQVRVPVAEQASHSATNEGDNAGGLNAVVTVDSDALLLLWRV